MPTVVALVGGGIKGAVAAAKYAVDHDLILLHIGHGQAACERQRAALGRLCRQFTGARLLASDVTAPHELTTPAGRPTKGAQTDTTDPNVDPRGLLPVMISLGLRCAIRHGAHRVVTGISQAADEAQRSAPGGEGRPDFRREFIHAADIMAEAALTRRTRVAIEAPLVGTTYPDILRLAVRFQVPLEKTWTCQLGGQAPCRRCAASPPVAQHSTPHR